MTKDQKFNSDVVLDEFVTTPYKYGFKTIIETEKFPKGLNLDIVNQISGKKREPVFLKTFRQKAFNSWQQMKCPSWAYLKMMM